MSRFTVTNNAGSLGDWLSLTPLLRAMAAEDPLVITPESPHTRQFATLYQGLAEVQFVTHEVDPTPERGAGGCFSRRILDRYGLTEYDPIPYVILTEQEKTDAANLLRSYTRPIVLNNTTASARRDKPETSVANYRRLPDALTTSLVTDLRADGLTPIRFGTKATQTNIYDNHEVILGVHDLPDLPLRQLAACYAVIGEYIGTDTGDHHLMLAVGGRCTTFVPPSIPIYEHGRSHYTVADWGGREPREHYVVFLRDPPTSP